MSLFAGVFPRYFFCHPRVFSVSPNKFSWNPRLNPLEKIVLRHCSSVIVTFAQLASELSFQPFANSFPLPSPMRLLISRVTLIFRTDCPPVTFPASKDFSAPHHKDARSHRPPSFPPLTHNTVFCVEEGTSPQRPISTPSWALSFVAQSPPWPFFSRGFFLAPHPSSINYIGLVTPLRVGSVLSFFFFFFCLAPNAYVPADGESLPFSFF